MALFAKAAQKAKAAPRATKKETVWVVGDKAETAHLAKAVHEFVDIDQKIGTLQMRQNLLKGQLKEHGTKLFVTDYALVGVSPQAPMRLQTTEGEAVTFVVQDRSSQYNVSPDQQSQLNELLGERGASEILYNETTFSFDRVVMGIPGVAQVIEKALERALAKLTEGDNPILSPELAEELVAAKEKTAFKPGTLDRLVEICGKDTVRIEKFLDIMGSSATRYVKA